MKKHGLFPHVRLRRNRKTKWLRDLMRETNLSTSDLVWPVFVRSKEMSSEISTMPEVFRYTVDELSQIVEEAQELGILALAIFPCIDPCHKTEDGCYSWDENSLTIQAINKLNKYRDKEKLGIIADVALDPYTISGHDGILNNVGYVDNDKTLEALKKQALTLANAGVDVLAPSDMMDGRIQYLRNALELEGLIDIGLMSYSAKFSSAFYGPFRNALGSDKFLKTSKKCSYQMPCANSNEAMREIELDITEGADAIIVKPGMPYLDIISRASCSYNIPIFGYQVSGEYSMIKYACQNTDMDEKSLVLESLLAFKRAGCVGIWTYFAPFIARLLQKQK